MCASELWPFKIKIRLINTKMSEVCLVSFRYSSTMHYVYGHAKSYFFRIRRHVKVNKLSDVLNLSLTLVCILFDDGFASLERSHAVVVVVVVFFPLLFLLLERYQIFTYCRILISNKDSLVLKFPSLISINLVTVFDI